MSGANAEADKNSELIDVLDENGLKTGQIVTRGEAHQKGLWHRISAVTCVDSKNRALVQQRSAAKQKNPNRWSIFSAAGHITTGQDGLSAAAREVSEEVALSLGINVSIKDFRYMTTFRVEDKVSDDWTDRQYYDYFIYRLDDIDVDKIKFQESEVQALKLVDASELGRMFDNNELIEDAQIGEVLMEYLFKF
jgi:isopentenyldiphosphate isomerase